MKLQFLILIIVSICIKQSFQYGESNPDGNPKWQDRESHVWLNAIRMAPKQFVSSYYPNSVATNFMNPASYPIVAPLYISDTIMRMAIAHSVDMANTPCFQHDDCNGTDTGTRFDTWMGSCKSGWAENIAAGGSNGLSTNFQLICEANQGQPCFADGVGDGHRVNIMSPSYKIFGPGYAYNANNQYGHIWTQDFFGSVCGGKFSNPIYGGSHTFLTGTGLIYIANWYLPNSTPSAARVYIKKGTSAVQTQSLTLNLGSSTQGSYVYVDSAGLTSGDCQAYVFEFEAGGNKYRYPDTGSLYVVKSSTSQCKSWNSNEIIPSPSTSNGGTTGSVNTTTTQGSTTTGQSTTTGTTRQSTTGTLPTSTSSVPTTTGNGATTGPTNTTTKGSTTTGQSTTTGTTRQSTTGSTGTTQGSTTGSTGTTQGSTTTDSTGSTKGSTTGSTGTTKGSTTGSTGTTQGSTTTDSSGTTKGSTTGSTGTTQGSTTGSTGTTQGSTTNNSGSGSTTNSNPTTDPVDNSDVNSGNSISSTIIFSFITMIISLFLI